MALVRETRMLGGLGHNTAMVALGAGVGLSSALLVALAQPKLAAIVAAAIVVGVVCATHPRVALYLFAATLMVSSGYLKVAGFPVFGAVFLWAMHTRRRLWRPDRLFALIALIILASVLAFLTATTRVNIFGEMLTYVGYLVLYWCVIIAIDNKTALRYLLFSAGGFAVLTALVGLAQYRLHFSLLRSQYNEFLAVAGKAIQVDRVSAITFQGWAGQFRIESLDGVPDFLALHMAVVAPFIFYWTLIQKKPRNRALGVACLLIVLAAAALTYSRTAMLAVGIVPIVLALKFGVRRAMPVLLPLVLVGAIVVVGYSPLRTRVTSIFTEVQSSETTAGPLLSSSRWRVESDKVGLEMLKDRLFWPAGAGQQRWLWRDYRPELVPLGFEFILPLHLSYLLTGIELGFLGLFALLGLLLVAFRWTRRMSRQFKLQGERELWAWSEAAQVALIEVFIAGFFYPVFDKFRFFWLLIAVVGVLHRLSTSGTAAGRRTAGERG
jgi:hypothetical protein